ncbi:MAG: BrnT family toxin [Proteobacteria bacterium]|nr:BrnT family toxin [Pseudomonadota bacterium]
MRRFEWDPSKARSNFAKHGVSFAGAIEAFDDPGALEWPDEMRSEKEERLLLLGRASLGVLVVVFTRRGPDAAPRIISARRASRRERRLYEATR